MHNDTTENGILPPCRDDSLKNQQSQLDKQPPNTRESSECSPDYNQKIVKALFPYSPRDETVETTLNDNHGFILYSLVGQVELLRDLGNKISGNEDIEGYGLAGFADSLGRQLKVLEVVQGEYHTQVSKLKDQHKKALSECERAIHEDAIKIKELERTIAMLKGGAL